VTGGTGSTDFPVTSGVSGGGHTFFVTRLSADGTSLMSSLRLPGNNFIGTGIAIDPTTSEAVVAGHTTVSIPITAGAEQGSYGGGYDGFLARVSADGTTLTYATYLGGSGDDYVHGVALDSAGDIVIAGYTSSSDFPVTQAYDDSRAGAHDAFLARYTASGRLLQATYYGGTGDETAARQVAVDALNRVYLAGTTTSTDLPTVNPVQGSYGGGSSDAFLARFDSLSAPPAYATYLGGSGTDTGNGVAVDSTAIPPPGRSWSARRPEETCRRRGTRRTGRRSTGRTPPSGRTGVRRRSMRSGTSTPSGTTRWTSGS
jgi:hypothetical protein